MCVVSSLVLDAEREKMAQNKSYDLKKSSRWRCRNFRQFTPVAFYLQLSPHIAVCCCLGTANIAIFPKVWKHSSADPNGGGMGGEPPYLINQKVS